MIPLSNAYTLSNINQLRLITRGGTIKKTSEEKEEAGEKNEKKNKSLLIGTLNSDCQKRRFLRAYLITRMSPRHLGKKTNKMKYKLPARGKEKLIWSRNYE